MSAPDTHHQINEVIAHTLHEVAHRSETRIAWVRVFAFSGTVGLYGVVPWISPGHRYPMGVGLVLTAFAIGVLLLLRRGRYFNWMPLLLPAADAAAILLLHGLVVAENGAQTGPLVNVALLAALLAMSGGLRLRWHAVLCSTLLGMGVLTIASVQVGLGATDIVWQFVSLGGVGAMAAWMTRVVYSSTKTEVERTILARFLPPSVVSEARVDPLSLLGEPRSMEATVLVSDIRGFTRLSEALTPVETLAFLNTLQGAFAAVVHQNGGIVDKFMGDGMLAVFGAPTPIEDHADRALAAAAGILRAVRAVNWDREARDLEPVGIGVAVHSGPVVAGIMGTGRRLEFTVVGDTVNAASRLEGQTKELGVSVLVSGATKAYMSEVPATIRFKQIGDLVLRGRRKPVPAWTLEVD